MVRRKRDDRLRAAVFVDGDNVCGTFKRYGIYPNLDDLVRWLSSPDAPWGINQVVSWCYFRTYRRPETPREGDRPFRQPGPGDLQICDHRHRARFRLPGYPDEAIKDHVIETINQWDTAFLVTSDVSDFEDFADYIRSPKFPGKEAVIIASHLSAYPDWHNTVNNGYSLEAMYPDLMKRFRELRGFHPERTRPVPRYRPALSTTPA